METRGGTRAARARRGAALVAALALLALAGGLMTAAFANSIALARAARTAAAALRADAAPARAFAGLLARWGAAEEAVGVGQTLDLALPPEPVIDGLPIGGRAQLRRLAPRRYALSVEVRIGDTAHLIARRRHTLLLERRRGADTSGAPAPTPLLEWPVTSAP